MWGVQRSRLAPRVDGSDETHAFWPFESTRGASGLRFHSSRTIPLQATLSNVLAESIMASLAGSLLVARPSLKDAFFHQAVVLLLQHGSEGAFGLVLNRPAPIKDAPLPVCIGGPCKFEGFLLLHGH